MVIDSHAHVMEPTEKQLSLMEEGGGDKAILFSTSIHPEKTMDLVFFEREIRRLFDILAGFESLMELGKLPVWIHTFHPTTLTDLKDIAGLARK